MRSSSLVVLCLVTVSFMDAALTAACGGGGDDAHAGDAGTNDGALDELGPDARTTGDASTGDGGSGVVEYHDIASAASWSAFDLADFNPDFANRSTFFGGAFDGRYVYLNPLQRTYAGDGGFGFVSSIMVRYDTRAAFGAGSSWSEFDIGSVNPFAGGYVSAAFDGRYLHVSGSSSSKYMARYDTQAPFAAKGSWSTSEIPPSPPETYSGDGYYGLAFDGRYVHSGPLAQTSPLVRHDTQSSDQDAGWSKFDDTKLTPPGLRTRGAIFDGRYVYFVPGTDGIVANGVAVRYDTLAPYDDAGAWRSFDLRSLNPKAKAFAGGSFDGRYVYFAPFYQNGAQTGTVARLDTQGAFDAATSWTTFDLAPVVPGPTIYCGSVFDGRFLWLVPNRDGRVARLDTTRPFGDAASWSSFDMMTIHPKGLVFQGAVFDGEFVYFVPAQLSVVLRFHARTPAALPPSYHGSTF